jgi:hypothetical protein
MATNRYCEYEANDFPSTEFDSGEYGWIHTRNLGAGIPVHTVDGDIVPRSSGGGGPPPRDMIPEDILPPPPELS